MLGRHGTNGRGLGMFRFDKALGAAGRRVCPSHVGAGLSAGGRLRPVAPLRHALYGARHLPRFAGEDQIITRLAEGAHAGATPGI
jgi:hypothetical protein